MTTRDLEPNAAYELRMREIGKDKWNDRHLEATEVSERPHHFNKLKQALPKVSLGIAQALKEQKKTKGRPPAWVTDLASVDPDVLAYVGLLCSFNGVLKDHSVTQVLQNIGELIEKELLKRDLMLDDKAAHAEAVAAAEALGLERPKTINTNKLADTLS